MENERPKYDLEERTAQFGEAIIDFAQKIPKHIVNKPLITQLVKAGTSVGANYCEADDAFTKKDFLYKIGICKKESRESKYWLRMVLKAVNNLESEIKTLSNEARELNLIFASIINKSKDN